MKTISYHRALQSDAGLLAALRTEFIIEFAGKQNEEDVLKLQKILTDYFRKAIIENTCIAYIARHENEIAGTGAIALRVQPGNFRNPTGRIAYVMNMYTIPRFRKNGICTTILNMLINDAREYGITAFELHATKEGEPIYMKNGFKIHNEPTYRRYF